MVVSKTGENRLGLTVVLIFSFRNRIVYGSGNPSTTISCAAPACKGFHMLIQEGCVV